MSFADVFKSLPHLSISEADIVRTLVQYSKFANFLKDIEQLAAVLKTAPAQRVLKDMRFSELMGKIEQLDKNPHDPAVRAALLSEFGVNVLAAHTEARPLPFTLFSAQPSAGGNATPVNDYTSWPGLTDKTWSSRHLPPASQDYIDALPPVGIPGNDLNSVESVSDLFRRGDHKLGRSSVLFGYFAQWFTDSFLRVNQLDRRKNTSNHEIDLCQIYGLTEETARMLRSMQGGRLSSQMINGEEYPEYLYELGADGKYKPREKYAKMPYLQPLPDGTCILDKALGLQHVPESRKASIYATGLERGNSSMGYVSMTVIFLREHNRLAGELQKLNPGWDDERIFQTARMINIVLLLRIVVEDYINHIAGAPRFVFDNTYAEDQNWYRTNWISLEFDMLYRWHGLVPSKVEIGDETLEPRTFQCNNEKLQEIGMTKFIDAASRQQTGQISLFNTPGFILWTEKLSIQMGRDARLRSFNDYREHFSLPRLTSWEQLTDDQQVLAALKKLYPQGIDQLELIIGLFAEKPTKPALFGDLLNVMVSVDAFTQALTNPLLSKHVFNANTFTQFGLDTIKATPSLQAMVARNVKDGDKIKVSFGYEAPKA